MFIRKLLSIRIQKSATPLVVETTSLIKKLNTILRIQIQEELGCRFALANLLFFIEPKAATLFYILYSGSWIPSRVDFGKACWLWPPTTGSSTGPEDLVFCDPIKSSIGKISRTMGNFPKEMSGSTHGQTIKNKIKVIVIKICFMRMGGYISSRGARVVLYWKDYPSIFLLNPSIKRIVTVRHVS